MKSHFSPWNFIYHREISIFKIQSLPFLPQNQLASELAVLNKCRADSFLFVFHTVIDWLVRICTCKRCLKRDWTHVGNNTPDTHTHTHTHTNTHTHTHTTTQTHTHTHTHTHTCQWMTPHVWIAPHLHMRHVAYTKKHWSNTQVRGTNMMGDIAYTNMMIWCRVHRKTPRTCVYDEWTCRICAGVMSHLYMRHVTWCLIYIYDMPHSLICIWGMSHTWGMSLARGK